ncbi:MAG: hypothetical protein OHK0029_18470 [Armatimonadaceae bacterium]
MLNTMPDLWPTDIEISVEDATVPVVILRQQASLLGEKTRNLVQGEIVTKPEPEFSTMNPKTRLVHRFYLNVATVDNYRYELLKVSHGLEGYPVLIHTVHEGSETNVECSSPEEFTQALGTILSSSQTLRIVRTLMAQAVNA